MSDNSARDVAVAPEHLIDTDLELIQQAQTEDRVFSEQDLHAFFNLITPLFHVTLQAVSSSILDCWKKSLRKDETSFDHHELFLDNFLTIIRKANYRIMSKSEYMLSLSLS